MDRTIVYPGEIPLDTMILTPQRDTMIALGWFLQSVFGTTTGVVGLAATQTNPASMVVNVGAGAIWSAAEIDPNAFGSLASDTSPLMKMGILPEAAGTSFTLTAPGTSGDSINYLIEATFQETDNTPVVLPYVNPSNPALPYSGPSNSGAAQNTFRQELVELQLKAGAAAATGTQTTPATDAGYVPLYVITVAYGQITVVSGNIAVATGAPFNAGPFAMVTGNSGQTFNVANAITSTEAVALGQVQTGYAALAGLGTQVFSAANATPGTQEVVPIAQGDARYVLQSAPSAASGLGAYSNLRGQTTSNTARSWTADALIVVNASGGAAQLRSVSVAYATGTIGANGYDGNGALGVSQWLYDYIIYNGTTAAALCSHSATAPTLPSGYTFSRRVGACWLDSSGFLMRVIQAGAQAQYLVTASTNTANLPIMASGVQGNPLTPTWVAVSLATFVPPTAAAIDVVIAMGSTSNADGIVAPNAAYGAGASVTNPPPLVNSIGTAGGALTIGGAITIEGASIYVASNSTIAFAARGWEDNL